MKTYYKSGEIVDYTAGSNIAAGDVVPLGNRLGIALDAIASGAVGPVAVCGVYKVTKDAVVAWTQDCEVFWDATAAVFTAVRKGLQRAGLAFVAAGSSATSGYLALNAAGANTVKQISQVITRAGMTDGTSTSGYIDLTDIVPAGSIVLGWKAVTTTAFTGDTTAVMTVGISGGTSNFSALTTASVFGAGTVASAAVAATAHCAADTTVRVTVTGTADFTSITQGAARVTVFYI